MLRDVTLGQFFPGNSLLHKLDPRTKLICVVLYIVALFTANSILTYALLLILLVACIKISRVGWHAILNGMKPVFIILVFTGILNLFYTSGGTELVHFWVFTITSSGLERAVFMVVRIMMLISGTFLMTYTTSPIALTDGLESLLTPLKKIKAPVHELTMIMSMALRFIPTLIEETDKIMSAQKARGADFESGNLIQKVKSMVPLMVPLFVSAFRRADELAVAMECRCYHGGEGRTRMKQLHMQQRDYMALVLFAALVIVIAALRMCFGL